MNRERTEAKMTDREALAAALDQEPLWIDVSDPEWRTPLRDWVEPIIAAARERLAQLPEKCEHGKDKPHPFEPFDLEGLVGECPGKVYPAELVERIAQHFVAALMPYVGEKKAGELVRVANAHAVAVLDAFNGETE